MKETRDISKTLGTVPGLLIGAGILALSLLVYWVASKGFIHDESGWALGWSLVATLLLGAGLAAVIGTWWHNKRVRKH